MSERPLVVGTGNIVLDHLFLVENPPLFGRYAKVREHLVQGGGCQDGSDQRSVGRFAGTG